MEVSLPVNKIIKFTIYITVSLLEKVIKDANYMYISSSVKYPQAFWES